MSGLFLAILNMSLTASYVILFVILVRLLLRKAPKAIFYALWGVVAFRLIIPFSFESMFSLMPRNTNAVPIPHDIIYQQIPQINSGIEVFDSFVSESLPAPTVGASANTLQIYIEVGAYIWVLGIIVLLVYSLVSILTLKRQLKSAELIEQNIFEAKNLITPFVLGLIKPKIYLPVGLNLEERSYILLHEQTHINRKDHIIKVLAFLILSIHWFNPLVWIAFILMDMDMELSCDEQVLKKMNEDIKKPYAKSLLSLATGRHILNGSPLAFGEGNVKGRIKNVLNYKKPRFWIGAISIIVVTAVGIGLMANPKTVTIETVAMEIGSAEELWEARTKYIGDNSAVGKLISLLPVPGDVQYDYFELYTSEQPYDIEIVYSASSEVLKHYDTEEMVKSNPFRKNALILLTLVDNAKSVRAVLTDGKREVGFINTREWADYTVGEDVRNFAESPEKLQKLIDFSLMSTDSNGTEQINIKPTEPKLPLEQTVGVDMVQLDYASDDIVIFHDYFGLFVYDIYSLQIIRSLDLKPLNCHQTQGDNYCDVSVSMDGNTVQLHPMSSGNMFVYTVSDNTLLETAYKPMDNPFRSQFVPIEKVINSTKLGNYSHQAVLFDIGEYGYLLTEDWTVGTLSYVREDMVLRLFDIKVSLSDRRPMIMVNDRIYMDTGKIVSTEIGDSDIVGEVVSSVAQHEKPTENGQTNFGSIGSKYAYYEENIVVSINNKWVLFERE